MRTWHFFSRGKSTRQEAEVLNVSLVRLHRQYFNKNFTGNTVALWEGDGRYDVSGARGPNEDFAIIKRFFFRVANHNVITPTHYLMPSQTVNA